MAPYKQKRQQKRKSLNKIRLTVGAGLIAWIAMLISPLGSFVALLTILGLIIVLFVLGCLHVNEDDFKK